MNRLLPVVCFLALLLAALWLVLGRGKRMDPLRVAPLEPPTSAPRASEAQPEPPAPERSVSSSRSAAPAALEEPPAALPFARDHASFAAEDALWLDVTVRFPAQIPLEDAPALLGFASTDGEDELDEGDAGEILRALDMSDRFAGELDDDVAWSRRDLAGGASVSLPFPPRAKRGFLLLQSRFFHLEPVAVDLETSGAQVLEPALGAWVSGRCVLPLGAETRGIVPEDIELELDGRDKDGGFMAFRGSEEREVQLADDFGFELCALATDRKYAVSAQTDGLVPYVEASLEVLPGEHRVLEIAFELGATLAGRVLGDDGTPIEGAEVSTRGRRMGFLGASVDVTTAADGSFELAGVRAGKVTLHASCDGWLDEKGEPFVVANGDVVRGLELVLGSGRKITGTVLWSDGSPALGASIEARQREGFGLDASESKADATGAFVLGGFGDEPVEVVAKCKPDDEVRRRLGLPPGPSEQKEAGDALDALMEFDPASRRAAGKPASGEWLTLASGVAPDTHGLVLTLRPPIAVPGTLADDTGAPIAKFRVEAQPAGRSNWSWSIDSVARSFEAADGTFEVDVPYAGEWSFSAEAEGFASSAEPLVARVPASEPLRLVLARAATLSGRVVDPDGRPVADASVSYSTEGNANNFGYRNQAATTDASGAFTLAEVGGTHVTVAADHEAWAASEPLVVELEPGKTQADLVLALRVGARISGEVFDAEGRPEAGQNVNCGQFRSGNGEDSTRTDAAGHFLLEHVTPGKVTVSAVPSEEEMIELMSSAEDETAFIGMLGEMRMTVVEVVDGGEAHVVLGAKAKSPVRVTGRITSDGDPLAGAGLVVIAEGGALLTGMKAVTADENGRYEVVLDRPGDHVFGVSKAGFMDGTGVQFYVSVPEAEEFEVDLALPLGRIEGRIVGPDGMPLSGVRVRIAESGGILGIEDIDESRTQSTAGDGTFGFEHLRAGGYALFAGTTNPFSDETPRFATAIVDGIEVGADESVDGIEIRLATPGKLAGTVRDDAGQPIAGATVFVRDDRGRTFAPISRCRSDAAGRFLYAGLAPGRVSASARAQDLASPDSDPVTIRAGETSEVDLVLARGTYLVVSLLDGEETVRARLRVLDEEDRVVSDLFTQEHLEHLFAEGFSSKERRVGPLAPGKYTLIAVSLDGKEAKKSVTVEADQEERHVKLRLK